MTVYTIDLDSPTGYAIGQALRRHVRTASGGREAMPGDADAADIRRWARQRGIPVGSRGRIPNLVLEQFYDDNEPDQAPEDDGHDDPYDENDSIIAYLKMRSEN